MSDLDLKILRAMRTRGHTPALERAAKLLGKAGNNGAGWFVANAALAAADAPRRRSWAACAALGPAAIGMNFGIKLIVRRPRPVLEGWPPLGSAPSSHSFPSAHATSSFAVAVAMTRVDRRAALAFVPAAAIAAGRPYLGMHYPSDVAVGMALGLALGSVVPLADPADTPLPAPDDAPLATPGSEPGVAPADLPPSAPGGSPLAAPRSTTGAPPRPTPEAPR